MYLSSDTPLFKEKMKKLFKRDRLRYERIIKKISEILEEPHHYKPLGNILTGVFRVHIDPFIVTFKVDEINKIVKFLDFDHHDNIYKN